MKMDMKWNSPDIFAIQIPLFEVYLYWQKNWATAAKGKVDQFSALVPSFNLDARCIVHY